MSNICRYFAATGSCYYGDQCNFLHTYPNSRPLPTEGASASPLYDLERHAKSQRPCRNIEIYGYCKFAGKGCDYNHDMQVHQGPETEAYRPQLGEEELAGMEYLSISGQKKDQAQYMQDRNFGAYGEMSPQGDTRPRLFQPPPQQGQPQPTQPRQQGQPPASNGGGALNTNNGYPPLPHSSYEYNHTQPSRAQSLPALPRSPQRTAPIATPNGSAGRATSSPYYGSNPSSLSSSPTSSSPYPNDYARMLKKNTVQQQAPLLYDTTPRTPGAVQHGGTTYFYDPSGPPPSLQFGVSPLGGRHQPRSALPAKRNMQSFFMSESFRQDILKRNSSILAALEPDDERIKSLPTTIGQYHSFYPLDIPTHDKNARVFGYVTSVYKCISSVDGMPYVLRRVEGFRLTNKFATTAAEIWKHLQHPNIITLRSTFISKEFEDVNSLFFVYDFHPLAESLENKHITQGGGGGVPEAVLWSYIAQLCSALKVIHNSGLSCRVIDASKILVTGKNRIRISGVGIFDVISFENEKDVSHFQREDLLSLGKLILSLACKSSTAINNLSESLDFIATQYSPDLKNLVVTLLRQPSSMNYPSIDTLCTILAPRFMMELESLHNYNDLLESELTKELENGRLFRLVVKLGFINERPEYDLDPSWSETGDHYMLKLFRDYLFHQVYDTGGPAVDFAHVVDCLNKLDVGTDEKILLMSRDESSVLVVSYKELKRCIENTFKQLFRKQTAPPQQQQQSVTQPQGATTGLLAQQLGASAGGVGVGGVGMGGGQGGGQQPQQLQSMLSGPASVYTTRPTGRTLSPQPYAYPPHMGGP